MKVLISFLFFGIVMIPSVVAFEGTDQSRGILRQHLTSFSVHDTDITTDKVLYNDTYDASRDHAFEVLEHRLTLEIEMTSTIILDAVGDWNLTISQDGTPLQNCFAHFPTESPGGFLEGDLVVYPHFSLHCERLGSTALNNVDHTHLLNITIAIDSGSPSPLEHIDISLSIFREDVVILSHETPFETLTNTNALEFFALLALLLLALFFWMRVNDGFLPYLFMILAAVPGLVWLDLFLDGGQRLLMGLATASFITSLYMGIRTGVDQLRSPTGE